MRLHSPFGPSIGEGGVDPALVARLNLFADGRIHPNRSSEFIVPYDVATATPGSNSPSLLRLIEDVSSVYVQQVDGMRPKAIIVDRIWIVSQYENSASPVHFHSGDLSGIIYLKAPASMRGDEGRNYIGGRRAGFINFMTGGKQPLAKSLISFQPIVGRFYVFPAWLLHGAEPFDGDGERRSLSFNARVVLPDDA